jgi:hypothetical protein
LRQVLVIALGFLSASPLVTQNTMAGGVNPAALGKGDWIYKMPDTESRLGVATTQAVINYEAGMGMQWITVKCADGADTNDWSQFNPTLIAQAHAAGLKIFGWAYVYGNQSNNAAGASNVQSEINAALTSLDQGADGFIIDAEIEYEAPGQSNAAAQYCQGIRARYPNTFLAYAPFPFITNYPGFTGHPNFPYAVFGYYCDAVMPQTYWSNYSITPVQMIADLDGVWSEWQSGLTGTNRNAIKPIIPVAQSDSPAETGADISAFVTGLKTDAAPASAGGYHGVSFWNCQQRNTNMDTAVLAANIGAASPPPQFAGIGRLANGWIQLELTGQVGGIYAIDVSRNLTDWTQLVTFTNATGDYQFMDASATNNGQGYYRARLLSQ